VGPNLRLSAMDEEAGEGEEGSGRGLLGMRHRSSLADSPSTGCTSALAASPGGRPLCSVPHRCLRLSAARGRKPLCSIGADAGLLQLLRRLLSKKKNCSAGGLRLRLSTARRGNQERRWGCARTHSVGWEVAGAEDKIEGLRHFQVGPRSKTTCFTGQNLNVRTTFFMGRRE
jgi:hypothetical protein